MKSVFWSLVLGILFIPLLILSVVMLPWIPIVARSMDIIARWGAMWLGQPIPPRRPRRWFDWQQFYHLLLQLAIGCCAFAMWIVLGFLAVALSIAPFSTDELIFGTFVISDRWLMITISWACALLAFVLLTGLAKLVTFASVAMTRLTLSPSAEDSRTVLIDSFSGERRRIERELHDGPQQYLTALRLNLAAARRGDTDALEVADYNASQALAALRNIVRGIVPQVLFDRGLIAALEELLAHSGLDTSLICRGTVPLDETPALLAYHCVAEGLTNAVKHGQATQITVEVDMRSIIRVSVCDNGIGPGEGEGTGIAGLNERAAALGGSVYLDRAGSEEQGSVLRLELP